MTISSAQASKFYEQVVTDGRVFTFLAEGSFLVFPMHDGEVVPFWSSLTRLTRIRSLHPKYRRYEIDEIPLSKFLGNVVPQLAAESIRIGVNWSGKRLSGYDISADELRTNIQYWIDKHETGEA